MLKQSRSNLTTDILYLHPQTLFLRAGGVKTLGQKTDVIQGKSDNPCFIFDRAFG